MQEITRFEADKLVSTHAIIDRNFCQDKKAMWFDFTLTNDQCLIVVFKHDTREKSYFLLPNNSAEEQTQFEWKDHPDGNSHQHQRFDSAIYSIN